MSSKKYKLTLTAEGPVHIGDGGKYGKKDYFLTKQRTIAILDVPNFVGELDPDQLNDYCEFLKNDSGTGLQEYLDKEKGLDAVAQREQLYTLNAKLARTRCGSYQYLDIWRFVKDAYGCPYVPGSSIKGMLRTAILTSLIKRDREAYEKLYDRGEVLKNLKNLKRADVGIQQKAFWVEPPNKDKNSAVNDILKYLSVSDSEPLSTDDLVLVKKYDKFSKDDYGRHKKKLGKISDEKAYYQGNELNIYRECLRPGTVISTTITIDERIGKYFDGLQLDKDGLSKALLSSHEVYQECFLSYFDIDDEVTLTKKEVSSDGACRYVIQDGPLAGMRCRNRAVGGTGYCNMHKEYAKSGDTGGSGSTQDPVCYLGGGIDFNTKTIENALFVDEKRRVDEVSHILFAQFPTKLDLSLHDQLKTDIQRAGFEPKTIKAQYNKNGRLKKAKEDHRHWCDSTLGVSPHTLKMGKIGDKMYPMGKCRARFEELDN